MTLNLKMDNRNFKKKDLKKILVEPNTSILDTLKLLNRSKEKCLIVVNHKRQFLGTITDGDIRRAVIKTREFKDNISRVYNKNAYVVYDNKIKKNNILNIIEKKQFPLVPILNIKKQPINYFSIKEKNNLKDKKKMFPVMIMAGGLGKRMQPFTSILPKPLIPINGKPVIIHIMNLFKKFGFSNINISLNYKSNILKSYLNELKKVFSLTFYEEKKPLGTAGILKKVNFASENFFLINCDGLFNINLNRLIEFHKENKNDLTIVASLKNFKIPYGVCVLGKKGILKIINEKPSESFIANTGFYLCSSKILKNLPNKKKFDMDEVIQKLIKDRKKISVFPIKDKDWNDTGNWSSYFDIFKKNA